ncbi:MAG TPA: NAD-dependent epimerase/dehydratase family protein [Actinomycetota bacterium]|jgi:UDP-glucose 4-epimerase|nr:NAD-dependent epimerase/dehydratase family protein [Actinomycetota bacterium]
MSDRVLVTGAAGFIGSQLCRRLVADGVEVVGLDDLSDGTVENLRDLPEVRLVEADLLDEVAVASAARDCRAILHQGAKRSVLRSVDYPALTMDVNIRGTTNVLLAARDTGAVVVSASSSSVYGDQDTFPLRESQEPRPRSPYAVSKLAAEVCCAGLHRSLDVRALSLRYFNVYGPGQDPTSEYALVVPLFTVACLSGTQPVIHGDGEQSRDFTYIDDVVEANIRAARAPDTAFGLAYNIGGGGSPTSVNRLLDLIARESGVKADPIYEPTRPGDVRMTHADVSLARARFGYEPTIGIDEGIRRTVASFKGVAA